jgi:DNA-binding transcriptional MerR regulator
MRPPPRADLLLITAFARLCGVSPKTLRLYEQLGLLRPVSRDPVTRYRYYSADQVRECAQIQYFKACGATLRQIRAHMRASLAPREDRRLLELLRNANLRAIDVARRSLAWIEDALNVDESSAGSPLYVTVRDCPPTFVVSVRLTVATYAEIHPHERALRAGLPPTASIGQVGVLWHRCADQATIEGEPFIEVRGRRPAAAVHQLPGACVASVFSTLDDDEAEAKYIGLSRWMRARGHALVGPRREMYRGGLLEIQYPLALA